MSVTKKSSGLAALIKRLPSVVHETIAKVVEPDARRILFWTPTKHPRLYQRYDIDDANRERVAKILADGRPLVAYMGWATCRLCGEKLGTQDMGGHGFIWPEKAEHYITVHAVWTPDCDRLLAAVIDAADKARRKP